MGLLGFDSSSSSAVAAPVGVEGGQGTGGIAGGGAIAGSGISVSNKDATAKTLVNQLAKQQQAITKAQTALTAATAKAAKKPTASNQAAVAKAQAKVNTLSAGAQPQTANIGNNPTTQPASNTVADGGGGSQPTGAGTGAGAGNVNTSGIQTISTETIETPDDEAVGDIAELGEESVDDASIDEANDQAFLLNSQNMTLGVVQSFASQTSQESSDAQDAALAQSAEISEAADSGPSGVELNGATPGLTVGTTQTSTNKLLIWLAVIGAVVAVFTFVERKK